MIADEIKKKEEEEEMKRQQHLQIQKFLKEEEKERKRTMASLKSHQRDSKSRISKAISMLVTDKRDKSGSKSEMLVTTLAIFRIATSKNCHLN